MAIKVYIAGRMRGVPFYNFPEFDKARDRLQSLGVEVFSPADMDRENGFDPFSVAFHLRADGFYRNTYDWSKVPPGFDLDAAVKRDNEAIGKADAVYVIHEGFALSAGAVAEVELAMSLAKTVVYDTMDDKTLLKALRAGCAQSRHIVPVILTMEGAIVKLREPVSPEVRYTDPLTGGQKGEKLARFDLLPPDILKELAEHYGKGARKYADRNMEKGYPWSKSYAACQRHLNAFWSREDTDAETGSLHLVAAAWHCFTMAWFFRHLAGTDDRPGKPEGECE